MTKIRITAVNCRLHSAGGICPPLPFIEVDRDDALALIEQKRAIEVDESGDPIVAEAVAEPAPEPAPTVAAPEKLASPCLPPPAAALPEQAPVSKARRPRRAEKTK